MNIEKPWRLEDVKFQDEQNGRRRGEIGPVTVLEIGGKYSLTSHALKFTWFDLDKRSVDAALNAAFNAWRGVRPERIGARADDHHTKRRSVRNLGRR